MSTTVRKIIKICGKLVKHQGKVLARFKPIEEINKKVNLLSNVHQVEVGKYIKREKDKSQLKGTTEPNDVKDRAEIGSPKVLTKLPNGNQEDPLEVMNF